MPGPEAIPRAEAEAFLFREARLLDERRFEEWLDLFAPTGRYLVPGGPGDDPALEAAIVDDDRATLADRVARLRSPAAYAQSPPSRTVRFVSNVEVGPGGRGDACDVDSCLLLTAARLGAVQVVTARCLHRLVPGGEGIPWRIELKRVRLVDFDRAQGNLAFLL